MEGIGFKPLDELDDGALKSIISYLEKFEVNDANCMDIQFGHNEEIQSIFHNIDFALKEAKGNSKREELLNRIKELADKIRNSAVVYAIRNNPGRQGLNDKYFIEWISQILDTPVEMGNSYSISNYVYIYLTNAKDKEDFIVRLETINGLLEQYKDILKEVYHISIQELSDKAKEDFESGEILGKKQMEDKQDENDER